ncbi:MAG: DUF885 family protein [Pirellulales bacterium]
MRCSAVVLVLSLSAVVLTLGGEPPEAKDASAEQPASSFHVAPTNLDATLPTLRAAVERYRADEGSLSRSDSTPMSDQRSKRRDQFYDTWLKTLNEIDFDALAHSGQVDYVLLRNNLERERTRLAHEDDRDEEIQSLAPFAQTITELDIARRRMTPIDSAKTAEQLTQLARQVDEARKAVDDKKTTASRQVANRALRRLEQLRRTLRSWQGFYDSYDPVFTWWTAEPYKAADQALEKYAGIVREKLIGSEKGNDDIIGDPIGREALLAELAHEFVVYTPEELIEIANKEFAWCEAEYKKAAADLGYKDDWRAALEHVKKLHVGPGEQPELIRKLAVEAIEFLDERDLVTIPPLCRETWRMEMMSPERQRVSPFFTGGEVITVSFPTAGMSHEDKLMSMRGNNIHFSRATVQHELIPGHHLQGFMANRYHAHRREFNTAFLVEGWALYWEMLLWDLGFPKSAEDRIGMLFWRSHRCARIIFSLRFHLGEMTAAEAINFLIDRVGHEPANAAAEVRRSVAGNYGPLYQAAYMLGGLQIRALRRELVEAQKMTDREFHDAILKENSIPIDLIRASLKQQPLSRDYKSTWRFYD